MIELPILDDARLEKSRRKSRRVWRSIGEFEGDSSLAELSGKEFMPEATTAPGAASRRQFIQLMGASAALAGLTGCRKPYEEILPYSRKPEEITPGIPLHYATGMPFRGSLSGLLVESHEGRPTKVEGNPQHPGSLGASGVFEQASILNLYDPDRSTEVLHNGGGGAEVATLAEFATMVSALPSSARLAVLIEENASPTIAALRARIEARFPQSKWAAYSAYGASTEETGYRMAYGADVRPVFRFSNAKTIVSLDADFLASTSRNFVSNTREFARSRSVDNHTPSRLYSFEATYSTTGGMADHRARVRPAHIAAVAAAIAARLGVSGVSAPSFGASEAVTQLIEVAVRDLRVAGPAGVVVAGDSQPAEVHALCAAINASLGAHGSTVDVLDVSGVDSARPDQVAGIIDDIKAGQVDVLLMIGVNPAYDLVGDQEFVAALASVGTSVHVGMHVDETARASTWHVPMTHYLEAWGDGRAYDGTLSVIQPLIAPLYENCLSQIEVLARFAGASNASGYDLVLDEWRSRITGSFDSGWRRVVHDGILPDSGFATVSSGLTGALPALPETATGDAGGFDVQILLDTRVLDGSYANNAWLQETPELVSKVVWDNVAIMNRATADALGVTTELTKGKYYADRVTMSLGGRSVTLPAWIMPGVADNTIVVWAGFGRDISSTRERRQKIFFDLSHETDVYAQGPLANGVGQNVNALRNSGFDAILTGVAVTREPDRYLVVTTQDHGALETPQLQAEIESREPVRTATAEAYRNHEAHFGDHVLPGAEEPWEDYPALWQDNHPSEDPFFKDSLYADNQWAMVIDLNTCTGCNACLVACQAENNVQVVGKRDVGNGREMSWIRLDRYFVSEGGNIDDASMVVQPLPCQHCENAPCESVCPVSATVHSPDGTNQMIYNRCIGTRYCANNCPYKVRRFNYYNWTKTLPVTVQMNQNPDVTVRFRGVMEKCSYCIQRIRAANRQANLEDRAIADGEVMTACQQACPANAITFGDINDPTSAVSQKKKSDRRYELLAELSVKPRTSYLGRLTNPNPDLEPRA